eukprot:CAMPEP_0116153506 /NCGR_PEP_ID=MMETSP0329-20121206/21283_1 /TAXON_ID=697910 /ORGANISM="Pseudo-nitzschia arenysensis, Strain B593" /LENGTH=158 /DNA_ID=CAMNT_0003650423 /DNA_START=283 /DNA_END=756 /DNA_ORIENTATION=-
MEDEFVVSPPRLPEATTTSPRNINDSNKLLVVDTGHADDHAASMVNVNFEDDEDAVAVAVALNNIDVDVDVDVDATLEPSADVSLLGDETECTQAIHASTDVVAVAPPAAVSKTNSDEHEHEREREREREHESTERKRKRDDGIIIIAQAKTETETET